MALLIPVPGLQGTGAWSRPVRAAGPLFAETAGAAGLTFTHDNGARGQFYLPEIMGAGVALLDYDGDGDLDVFLVQGAPLGPGAATPRRTSRLFRNDLHVGANGPELAFTDVTARAGVGLTMEGMGVATGDYDNDGHVDLFVTGMGRDALLHNNGNGTFTNVTVAAGVSDSLWSTGATFFDYDRDGDLDLFVTHYVDFTVAGNRRCTDPTGARDYCQPRVYKPLPDRLFRNDGHGHFTDVTAAAGLSKATGSGLSVVAGDFDGDGWLDLYVANDAMPNRLWINQRNGTFVDRGLISGSAVSGAGAPEASMGIASGDFDRDGDEDLFIANIVGETFVLYANAGAGLFEDVRARAGLATPTAAFTGFGTDWFDYDNDGWQDLFVANGGVAIVPKERGEPRPYRMTNQLFRNSGTGRFVETTADGGPDFQHAGIGRGAAFGDLDNDGRTDVVVTENGGPVRLLRNQAGSGGHWLTLQLDPGSSHRTVQGAWVRLDRAQERGQWRRVKTDGSYLSAGDPRVHFGLGSNAAPADVLVQWPDGRHEQWRGLAVDRIVTLRRGSGQP
jgi:hypothetical protein